MGLTYSDPRSLPLATGDYINTVYVCQVCGKQFRVKCSERDYSYKISVKVSGTASKRVLVCSYGCMIARERETEEAKIAAEREKAEEAARAMEEEKKRREETMAAFWEEHRAEIETRRGNAELPEEIPEQVEGYDPKRKKNFDCVAFLRLVDLRNLTLAELSRRTGIARSSVQSYSAGSRVPPAKRLILIAAALGVKPEELVKDAD